MRVIDTHRLLGPVPTGPAASTVSALIDRMDRLGIDHAVVTPSWHVFGDPRAAGEYDQQIGDLSHRRLTVVPCVIPSSVRGAGIGPPAEARIVRACPVRHRFDLMARPGREVWAGLAATGRVLVLDAMEMGLSAIDVLCKAESELKVLVVNLRYREVRRGLELLIAHPNLILEMGTLNSAGAVEFMVEHVGADRLTFGTGAPLHDDGGARFALDHLFVSDDEVELMAHGTWERFTGADDDH